MGMSTHVEGFKPADEKWRQMKALFDNCIALKISVPKEVMAFFEGDEPSADDPGVKVNQKSLVAAGAVREWFDDKHACAGFEIDVKKIPADVAVIRVFNSW